MFSLLVEEEQERERELEVKRKRRRWRIRRHPQAHTYNRMYHLPCAYDILRAIMDLIMAKHTKRGIFSSLGGRRCTPWQSVEGSHSREKQKVEIKTVTDTPYVRWITTQARWLTYDRRECIEGNEAMFSHF